MTEPRLLKKHANRRLYDTEMKKYVSLDQIRELINSGVDVRIEETATGDDITRPVLLQIMAECEQDGQSMLSSLSFYMRQEARLRKRMIGVFETLEEKRDQGTRASREALTAMRDNLVNALRSAWGD
jgi:polyhydroxyalkanoate synthesis repressor PhaR